MPELLTTEEAADYLRLSERKLYELVAGGALHNFANRWLVVVLDAATERVGQ